MRKGIISLCDYTGIFTKPWRDNGFLALHVDPQRIAGGTILEKMNVIRDFMKDREILFVAGFPPCTDIAVSGATPRGFSQVIYKLYGYNLCPTT